jgi:hypothetical protein
MHTASDTCKADQGRYDSAQGAPTARKKAWAGQQLAGYERHRLPFLIPLLHMTYRNGGSLYALPLLCSTDRLT